MSHRDPMVPANEIAPCTQSVQNLLRRINAHVEDREYGPLDIEVYTLYSLVQHRHSAANLDAAVKDRALAEIPKLLGPRSQVSKRLRPYLQMLEKNLQADKFPVMNIGEHLYRLKSVIREGWRKRHLKRDRLESVSEHTHLCCLLALLYLPEWDGDGPEYRKDDVIKTLLVHDIAEAEMGDTAYFNVTEETRASERKVMQYLQMCGTYLRVADMSEAFALWNDCDNGLTETAKIAADIDKLENLIQLYLYEQEEPVEGAAAWKQWVEEKIQTSHGQAILRIVKEKYEA